MVDPDPDRPAVAVFLKGYPRLSETFIAQEIRNLEKAGLRLRLVSLRHPTDTKRHPVHHEIEAPVSYLPEYLHDEPARVARAWAVARRLPGYAGARAAFLSDLARDRTRNRVRRFGQALVAAAEMPADVALAYAHFIHTPASVARYAAMMRALPFAVSAHAKDIWTSPDWELSQKLGEAAFTVTCTASGATRLRELAPDPSRVHLLYHGLDLARFPSPPQRAAATGAPFRILSVGRAVQKKGLDTLLRALALLPTDLDWRFVHIAGGPLLGELKALAETLGIAGRVSFEGAQAQARVLAAYREADVFALPCRIGTDGDRDGLPNVIVEAQSQRLAVVSTPISGIPELIEDGVNGLLVPPDDPQALAAALASLAADPARRTAMGRAGEERVRADFDADAEIGALVALLSDAGPEAAP